MTVNSGILAIQLSLFYVFRVVYGRITHLRPIATHRSAKRYEVMKAGYLFDTRHSVALY